MTEEILLYKGSTKDIFARTGEEYLFRFSDRYSIFDWGEMPDNIKGKGESTAQLTSFIYNYFQKKVGIPTHIIKKGNHEDELVVRKFTVPAAHSIQTFYQKRPEEAFVPLEVIFRQGVPRGSSLLERGQYFEGQIFSKPMIEFSTKLESLDRLLSDKEAMEISGMNSEEFDRLKSNAVLLANALKELVEENGFVLWDGKFEFAFIADKNPLLRNFMLVDSISLDELRLTYQGFSLSKEILRQIYKKTNWYQEMRNAKLKNAENFRSICSKPDVLNVKTKLLIQELYKYTQLAIMGEKSYLEKLKICIEEIKNEHPYLR
jgi:phosphoribosylaminoimidazole-succinocarboxamide synthase